METNDTILKTKYATYDTTRWPIVVATIHSYDPTREEFVDFLATFLELLDAKSPFCLIIDTTQATGITFFGEIIEFLKTNRPKFKETLICSAFVSTSALIKRAIAIVTTVVPPVRDNDSFSFIADALTWSKTECDKYAVAKLSNVLDATSLSS